MIKPAIVGAALVVGFLMQTAGLHWESIIGALIGAVSMWAGTLVREFFIRRKEANKLKLVAEGQSHRTSEAIAELDLEERRRIDAKQEQFIEMVRDLHAQQTANMQSIIDNQKAIIENQKESMKLKDAEIDKRGLQITEMQKQLLS
jgi:uncharacterized membrane protein (DUF106 family)